MIDEVIKTFGIGFLQVTPKRANINWYTGVKLTHYSSRYLRVINSRVIAVGFFGAEMVM